MGGAIEVQHWSEREGFAVDLPRLLAACPTRAQRLTWVAWSLRGTGSAHACAMVERFRDRPGGRALLSWGALLRLSRELDTVQWGVFAGFERVEDIVGPERDDFFTHPALALEAFDGWSWRVVARSPGWLDGFRRRFKAVAALDDDRPAPWWRR